MKLGTYINFKLPDQDGQLRDLNEFLGTYTVIYFYPKDNTPGCTIQANEYEDKIDEFKKLNVSVIGISKDDMKSHQRFIEKQGLSFTLLTDKDLEVSKKLGFAKEKKMFGNTFFGTVRSSLVLNEKNEVVMINKNTKAKEDATKVLTFIKNL